jgi:trans-AT polyketide synthase/acyltransferase/oxidoreductase domain-containing protein
MNVLSKTGRLRWRGESDQLLIRSDGLTSGLKSLDRSFFVLQNEKGEYALAEVGHGELAPIDEGEWQFCAYLPGLTPAQLGDATFCQDHRVDLPYVVGAMANGIASVELVEAASQAGLLGMFGSAGLPLELVEKSIDRLQASLGDKPFGSNLIHSPNEPALEQGVVDLYLRKGVKLVSASAYLGLTLPIVKYRFSGTHRDSEGNIVVPQKVLAKISRVEVADKFLSPPPEKMLKELVERGDLTAEEAELAAQMPVAEDLTAEADSGGHTDNRPALALYPTIMALRDEKMKLYEGKGINLRVGAAGGISTPVSACAAFAMGAAYIVTGSVNQSCVESGSSDIVRDMLCKASQADVAMAPAADMFEMGVEVQVLKWGTMFPVRAKKLYKLYRDYGSIEELPANERQSLEKGYFRQNLDDVWRDTSAFFAKRDPRQNERAAKDPRHKMALIFRSYLGRASGWANSGVPDRKVDYQVWCGPAMGAFNQWAGDSYFKEPKERKAGIVAQNIMAGAAYLCRVNSLAQQGVALTDAQKTFAPKTAAELDPFFQSSSDRTK